MCESWLDPIPAGGNIVPVLTYGPAYPMIYRWQLGRSDEG